MKGTALIREEAHPVAKTEPSSDPAPLAISAPPTYALLALQRLGGNQAVAALVGAGSAGADLGPAGRVDQLELAIRPFPTGRFFLIDRDAAVTALSGLTEEAGRVVASEYQRRTSWDLGELIDGDIEGGNNLDTAERTLLLHLLGGTVGPAAIDRTHGRMLGELGGMFVGTLASLLVPAGTADRLSAAVSDAYVARIAEAETAAEARRYGAQAAAIWIALDDGKAEVALALIPRATEEETREKQALAKQYALLFHVSLETALATKLEGRDARRAAALWTGDLVTADRLALEGDLEQQDKIEDDLDRFGASWVRDLVEKKLEQRRREARAAVESRLESIAADEDRGRGLAHLQAVLSEPRGHGTVGADLGVGWNRVVTALAKGNEPELLAARLARADDEGLLEPDALEAAFRTLPTLARKEVVREVERQPSLATDADGLYLKLVETYYQRFRTEFDNDDPMRSLSTLVSSLGDDVEHERNRALLVGRGVIPEWQELDFALRKDPQDIDTVRRVLVSKTATQVAELAAVYSNKTSRILTYDLMGLPEEQALVIAGDSPGEREALLEKAEMLRGGVFESTTTDEATRLAEEATWTCGRIVDLEARVMIGRGKFARVRDWLGNIEYDLVERSLADADAAKSALDRALALEPADLAAAHVQLAELRIIARRLRRNVDVYKSATAAAFDAFVDFAVLAITTAVTLGEGTAVMLAVRATAATIGTKLVIKGDDYTPAEFLGDLRGGLGMAVGGRLTQEMFGPLASKLATIAEREGLSTTLSVAVAGGQAAVWEGSNVVMAVTSSAVSGEGLPDLSLGWHLQSLAQHGIATAARGPRGHAAFPGQQAPATGGVVPAEGRAADVDPWLGDPASGTEPEPAVVPPTPMALPDEPELVSVPQANTGGKALTAGPADRPDRNAPPPVKPPVLGEPPRPLPKKQPGVIGTEPVRVNRPKPKPIVKTSTEPTEQARQKAFEEAGGKLYLSEAHARAAERAAQFKESGRIAATSNEPHAERKPEPFAGLYSPASELVTRKGVVVPPEKKISTAGSMIKKSPEEVAKLPTLNALRKASVEPLTGPDKKPLRRAEPPMFGKVIDRYDQEVLPGPNVRTREERPFSGKNVPGTTNYGRESEELTQKHEYPDAISLGQAPGGYQHKAFDFVIGGERSTTRPVNKKGQVLAKPGLLIEGGTAISHLELNLGAASYADPANVFESVRGKIDDAVAYPGGRPWSLGDPATQPYSQYTLINPERRVVHVALTKQPTDVQMEGLAKAKLYAKQKNIELVLVAPSEGVSVELGPKADAPHHGPPPSSGPELIVDDAAERQPASPSERTEKVEQPQMSVPSASSALPTAREHPPSEPRPTAPVVDEAGKAIGSSDDVRAVARDAFKDLHHGTAGTEVNPEWTKIEEEMKLLESGPGHEANDFVRRHAKDVYEAVRDPKLIEEVLVEIWERARRDGITMTKALRELVSERPDLQPEEAFPVVERGQDLTAEHLRRPLPFVDESFEMDFHGAYTHMVQELVVARKLGSLQRAAEFRQKLTEVENPAGHAGQPLWKGAWDAIFDVTSGEQTPTKGAHINRPEVLGRILDAYFGIRRKRS